MTQLQINRAFARSLKKSYAGLSAVEHRLVKKMEQVEQYDKDIAELYRWGQQQYGNGFRKHPDFQKDFELIFNLEEYKAKTLTSIGEIEEKYELDRERTMMKHRQNNTAKGYGGSF